MQRTDEQDNDLKDRSMNGEMDEKLYKNNHEFLYWITFSGPLFRSATIQ